MVLLALGGFAGTRLNADAPSLDPRIEAAIAVYREQGAEDALPMFQQIANRPGKAAPARDRVAVQHYLGECQWRLGNFATAEQHLERALGLARSAGDETGEGKALNVMGLLAWDQGNFNVAMDRFKAARAIAHRIGDRKLEGASLNNLGLVLDELGEYDRSLAQYKMALQIYRGADFPRGVGDTLGNIGGVHLLLGHYREALSYYQQALKISVQLNSKTAMSQDNGNIGLCLLGLGDVDAAIKHFDTAMTLADEAGMRQDRAYWMRAKGNGLVDQGRYDLGLENLRAALAEYEKIGAQAELLETLQDAGFLYLLLGDPDTAEKHYRRALSIARQTGLERGMTASLLALGDIEFRRRRLEAAAGSYEQARQRAKAAGADHYLAESLLRLALVRRQQSRIAEAASAANLALGIARRSGARPIEAEALLATAELNRIGGRPSEALGGYLAAEKTAGPLGDPDVLWQIHYGRGRTLEAQGNVGAAIASLLAAVAIIEGVRDRLQEPRFRAGYVEDKFQVYVDLARLQLRHGRPSDAFSTSERLRARVFVEQLGGRPASTLSPGDRQTEIRLRERVRHLQQLLIERDDEGRPAHQQRAIATFSRELAEAEQEYQAFIDDHAGPASTGQPESVADARDLAKRLHPDEAVVEYLVGPEHLITFVVTRRGVTANSASLRGADLDARVALLRDLMRRPGDDRWMKPAARLAADLVDPIVAEGGLDGVRRLLIVPYGSLNYVPFALLPFRDGRSSGVLIDRYTVEYAPTAAALLRKPSTAPGPRTLLAVAPARGGLRFAPEEARAVGALYEPNSRLLLGDRATEREFKRLAGDFRVLHLATHGYFNRLSPMLSGLELEPDTRDDGLLQVHEILDLRLVADLVTLSACETALGSGYFAETPAGDEFVGMTRAFLAAGSAAVMATLWDVDDEASVRLMRNFYQRLRERTGSRDAGVALVLAQRELRASKEYAHPYFWAPFVIVGGRGVGGEFTKIADGRLQ